MNWTKIKYNPNISYKLQETLPRAGVPIVCCKTDNFDLKISTLSLSGDYKESISIGGTWDIDGIWWTYLDMDGLPAEVTRYALISTGLGLAGTSQEEIND